MTDDASQDLESIAQALRQEREQLIVAWEQLESEQRQLAMSSTFKVPQQRQREEESPVREEARRAPVAPPPREMASMPAPPAVVRTVRSAGKTSSSTNTFRFLQREFDKPDEKRSS